VTLERAQLGLIASVVATCQVSIFVAQVLLTLAVGVYGARLLLRRATWPRLPLDGPVLAFAVWTLLSAAFSTNPLVAHQSAKKLVLFLLLYVAVDSATDVRARERIVDAALLGTLVLGAGALFQYFLLGFDTLNSRPTSFLGHYMTAAGLSMLGLVLAAARLVLRRGRPASPPWPPPRYRTALALAAFAASGWALVVSRTRNAWLGAVAGLAVVAVLRAPRTLWLLGSAVVAIALMRPAPVMDRLTVTDASSVDRYYMWQAGIDMIRDRPVFGQGPGMILSRYPLYRWAEAPNARAPHLHDNALQIAAERGLPCLAFWLWWMAAAMGDAYREWRRGASGAGWSAAAALAMLTAMMMAGLFEYNFGDSEVFMLVLVTAAFPYALRRERQVTIPAA
jgi:O-antigen ligase